MLATTERKVESLDFRAEHAFLVVSALAMTYHSYEPQRPEIGARTTGSEHDLAVFDAAIRYQIGRAHV